MAAKLASRLSRALAPLFARCPCENADFDTWGQEHKVSESRRFRLNGIFETALKLKAQTVVTDYDYRFMCFAPGTPYSDSVPGTITTDGSATPLRSDKSKCPSFWLHASFHAYRSDGAGPRNPSADALVRQRNFLAREKPHREDLLLHTKLIVMRKRESVGYCGPRNQMTAATTSNGQTSRGSLAEFSIPESGLDLMEVEQTENLNRTETVPYLTTRNVDPLQCVNCDKQLSNKTYLGKHLGKSPMRSF